MPLFKIWFSEENNNQSYEACYATNGDLARQWFHENWPSDIILRIENVTANEKYYSIASNLLSFAKKSPDPRIRQYAIFSKPVAAVAIILLEQYKHILENEQTDDMRHIASKVFELIIK